MKFELIFESPFILKVLILFLTFDLSLQIRMKL